MRLPPVVTAVALALAASSIIAPVATAAQPRWTPPTTIAGPAVDVEIRAFADGVGEAAAVAFDGVDYIVLASSADAPGWTVTATIPGATAAGRESNFSVARAGDTFAVAWCRKLPGAALGDIVVWTSSSEGVTFVDLDDVRTCRDVAIGGAVLAASGSPTFTVAWPIRTRLSESDVLQSRTRWSGQWLPTVGLWAETPAKPANYIGSPQVEVAANGAAAVGFIVGTPQQGVGDLPLLWIATRGAAQGGAVPTWAQAFAVGASGAPGSWDIALAGDAPSRVAIAWASDSGVLPTVQYANMTLVFGAEITRRQVLVGNGRGPEEVHIAATRERDLLAWVDVNYTTNAYTVRSSAWLSATNTFATVNVSTGTGFGSRSRMDFDAASDGRMALALYAWASIDQQSSIEVFQDTFTTPAALWATKTRAPIASLDAGTDSSALEVLVPASSSPASLLWSASTASTRSGVVQASREVTPIPPGRPTNVTATAGDASARVSWRAPADSGTSAITGYVVTSTPEGKTCTTTGALTCTVTGLANGRDYLFTVVATNADGPGAPSEFSNIAIPTAGRAPGAPTNVRATASDATASVTWVAPANTGSSPVIEYVVASTPEGKTCTTAGALSCTVRGLTNGVAYTFEVVARSADGLSLPSAASNQVVPTAAGPVPPATFSVKARKGGRIVLKWGASPSPDVSGYAVAIVKANGAQRVKDVGNVLTKTYRVKAGKRACYMVAAVSAAGVRGEWTAQTCVVSKR